MSSSAGNARGAGGRSLRRAGGGSSTGRAAALGALAAVFFLLPSPLTIEASDVYGGFALHIRIALVLALAGGLWGATRAHYLAGGLHGDGPVRRLLALAVGTTVLALAASAASGVGERLASELIHDGAHPGLGERGLVLRGLILRGVAIAALVRLAGERREGPLVLGTASVVLGTLAAGALLSGAVEATGLPTSFGLAGHVIAGIAIAAPLAGARLPITAGVASLAGTGAVVGCLAALLLQGPPPATNVDLSTVAFAAHEAARRRLVLDGLVLGSLLGGGLGAALAGIRIPIRETLGRPVSVAGHLLLFVVLIPAGSLLHDASVVAATMWAFPSGLIPKAHLLTPPEPAELGLVVAVTVGGLLARTGVQLWRWLGGVSVLWALSVVGHAVAVRNPEWGRAAWILPSLAGIVLAVSWRYLLRPGDGALGRALPAGFLLAGFFAGPVTLRFASASLLTWAPPDGVLFGLGGLLGAATGLAASRLTPSGRLRVDERIGLLLLVGVGVLLPFYIAVFLGLFPAVAAGTVVAAVAGGVVAGRRRLGGLSAAAWTLVVPWAVFYVAFAAVTDYRRGPSEGQCARMVERTDARVLVDRYALPPDQRAALPYDVLPMSDPDVVVASFKRIEIATGGFLLTVDRSDPERRHLLRTYRDDGPQWPERLVHDPTSGATMVQILGVGAYALWELHVGVGPETSVGRIVPLEWEPSNPGVDEARGRVVLSYVPNRGGRNPLVDVVTLDEMTIEEHHHSAPRGVQMSDWATVDPTSGHYWVAALVGPLNFMLTEIDGDSMKPIRRLETYFPTVGMEIDRPQRRALATNVIGGDVAAIDLDTLRIRQTVAAGAFPRDMAIDRERKRLYVAGYGDGFVHRFSLEGPEMTSLGKVEVGPLLRGIGLDPTTGRVVAASGCGIFELPSL